MISARRGSAIKSSDSLGISSLDAIRDVLSAVEPHEILIWSGAGISLDPPTNLHSGTTLVDLVADGAFARGTLDELRAYYESLDVRGAWGEIRAVPRLEFILDVAASVHGDEAFRPLLGYDAALPNPAHHLYADHLRSGGSHVTANFDNAIESALGVDASASPVLHFHGSLGTGGFSDLGATIRRIQSGFDRRMLNALSAAIRSSRVLIVTGYSGSDYFDVDPLFAGLARAGGLPGLTVLWIDHARSDAEALAPARSFPLPMVRSLVDARARVLWLCAPTQAAHSAMADAWRFDLKPPAPATSLIAGSPMTTPESQLAATVELWHRVGATASVERALSHWPGGVPSGRAEVEAMAAWHRGQYSKARRIWGANSRAGPSAELHRRERRGACYWASGRLIRAYVTLRRAIGFSRRQNPSIDATTALETLTRVVEHMGRTPDLRWFHRLVRDSVRAEMSDAAPPIDVHTRVRVSDAQRIAARSSDLPRVEGFIEDWSQVESLNAIINYRHRLLREREAAGTDRPRQSDYLDLFAQAERIGNSGDAARLMHLPGAERAWTMRELMSGVRAVDYSLWHRARILGHGLLRRL